MISERFIIPAIVAAAVHAAFFVISPARPPANPAVDDPRVTYVDLAPLAPLFDPPPPAPDSAESSGGSGEPVSSLPEPPVVPKPQDFVIRTPETVAPNDNLRIDRIPARIGPEGPGTFTMGGPPQGPIGREYLDHEPRARSRIAPDYPHEAKSRGLEGVVEVAFVVGPDGAAHSAYVVRSDYRELEAAAVRAVSKWRFEPGKYQGRPVSFRMSVPIVFRIAED